MIRKIIFAIVLAPLALVIVALAIANRQLVVVSFDPFSATDPAYAAKMPLFLLVFILLIAGVVVGGIAAWLKQGKWRRTARRLDAELKRAHAEMETLRRRAGESEEAAAPSMRWPLRALRPPAA